MSVPEGDGAGRGGVEGGGGRAKSSHETKSVQKNPTTLEKERQLKRIRTDAKSALPLGQSGSHHSLSRRSACPIYCPAGTVGQRDGTCRLTKRIVQLKAAIIH